MLVRLFSSPTAAVLFGGAALLAAAGCSSSGAAAGAVTHPTMIEVTPESFLGDVPCVTNGVGLKRYVATLFDVNHVANVFTGGTGGGGGAGSTSGTGGGGTSSESAPEFQLPSSLPTPCLAAVGFAFLAPGRYYRVEVDGFATDDLAPRAVGARQMVSPAPARPEDVTPLIAPSFHAACEATVAVDSTIVRAARCTTFAPTDSTAAGGLRIGIASLLGGLRCGDQAGEVDHLNVSAIATSPGAEPLHLERSVPCTPDAEVVLDELPAATTVTAFVSAFSLGKPDALAGAACSGSVAPGATSGAECATLSQLGTLRVDVPAALALLGLTCSKDDVEQVVINVPFEEKSQSLAPPSCLSPFDHGFEPGPAVLSVTAFGPGSAELGTLTCHGEVTPGQLASATCELNTAE